jgi:hypothetical protein
VRRGSSLAQPRVGRRGVPRRWIAVRFDAPSQSDRANTNVSIDVRASVDAADEGDDLASGDLLDGAAEFVFGAVLEPEPDIPKAVVLAGLGETPLERCEASFEEADG